MKPAFEEPFTRTASLALIFHGHYKSRLNVGIGLFENMCAKDGLVCPKYTYISVHHLERDIISKLYIINVTVIFAVMKEYLLYHVRSFDESKLILH